MPLEATMMILDNSEYMRNGDYPATRFDAMADAAHIIFTTKTDSNPENSVGVMTAAGKGPEVLVTHTRELGQIIQGAHDAKTKIGGAVDIPTAINVAQLALKHRQNKNLRQRIILFLGSPPEGPGVDEKNLIRLAKKLKKNNIALDVVAFGDGIEEGEETSLLKALVEGANSGDNSHYIAVPPDPRRLLSDAVINSPVLAADRGDRDATMADITNTAGAPGGDGFEEYGGIDPTLDPELAMVMRMSMEEEQARQRALQQAQEGQQGQPEAQSASTSVPAAIPAPGPSTSTIQPAAPSDTVPVSLSAEDEEEAALQEALRISQEQEDVEMADTTFSKPTAGAEDEEDEDEDEEAAIARAIEMSMNPEQNSGQDKK